jgi:hypothetical protein
VYETEVIEHGQPSGLKGPLSPTSPPCLPLVLRASETNLFLLPEALSIYSSYKCTQALMQSQEKEDIEGKINFVVKKNSSHSSWKRRKEIRK